jgi:hypothetical protein
MMYFGHIAGILRDPKNEWDLIRDEHYSATTVFFWPTVYIGLRIPALALFIGVTQVGWVSGPRGSGAIGLTQVRLGSAL